MKTKKQPPVRSGNAPGCHQDRPGSPQAAGEVSQHPRDGRFARLEKLTDVPAPIWKALAEDGKMDGGDGKMSETQVLDLPTEPMPIAEAAHVYGIARITLNKWISRGLIKVVRHGGGRGKPTLLDPKDLARVIVLYRATPGKGRDPLKELKRSS